MKLHGKALTEYWVVHGIQGTLNNGSVMQNRPGKLLRCGQWDLVGTLLRILLVE